MIHMLIHDSSTSLPSDTNTIESLNRHSIATCNANMKVEIEMNFKEDVAFCHVLLAQSHNIKFSYRNNSKEKRDERNRRRKNRHEESHPPERRNQGIETQGELAVNLLSKFLDDVNQQSLFSSWSCGHMSRRLSGSPFQNDKEVVLNAVRNDGTALEFASKKLKQDEQVIREAIQQNPFAILYVHARVPQGREMVKNVCRDNLTFMPTVLLN
ncbi:hypothetical protein FDP41_013396 [Naegleria fowleri]|uniref:DUF4116 domain-containing protein n=2 Tax=Naegleria fowleri TaxID=5763 RepID=A0A6A5C074_NAEFO|nr:uncharacterized protein FDP41_013396 [Naegleria fowleri]KAF0980182.1 hypothetical protein FDP41_013396 [Naegleria fowleri]